MPGEDSSVNVLVAGELFADLVMAGFEAMPGPGEEAFARDFRREPGGAAITAMGLARLGRRTGLIGAVGGLDGAWMLESFWRGGLDVSRVLSAPGEYSGTTVAISGAGDRAFLTWTGANRHFMEAYDDSSLLATHLHWSAPVDLAALRRARAEGLSVSLDVGYAAAGRHVLGALPLVDWFFPNEGEAARITGEHVPEAILRAFEKAGARGVVLKLGARGAAMLVKGQYMEQTPPKVEAVDTTGAGDCFDAGFLDAWLNGGSAAECLRMANLCGALSTRVLGGIAGFPRRDEIPWESK
jgi:sugar/nucleoside kinase (ribokinase family)